MNKTKLKNQLKKFEEHLIVDRGISKVTADGYCRSLSIALRRMRKFVPSYEKVKEYILFMHRAEYSYHHIVNTSLAIEHYTSFKCKPVKIGRPSRPKRIIQNTLSEAEVSRMIQITKNLRERTVIVCLAFSGMRVQELCNLKTEDVCVGTNQLTVIAGKNKKDRIVNISSDSAKILFEYIQTFSKKTGEYLFTTLLKGNRLATGDIRKLIRGLAVRAQIGRRVFPHLFRHSLATNLLNRGASLMMVKDQLGHSHLSTTAHYVSSLALRHRSEYDHFRPCYL